MRHYSTASEATGCAITVPRAKRPDATLNVRDTYDCFLEGRIRSLRSRYRNGASGRFARGTVMAHPVASLAVL